jgi:hypothetical protein
MFVAFTLVDDTLVDDGVDDSWATRAGDGWVCAKFAA